MMSERFYYSPRLRTIADTISENIPILDGYPMYNSGVFGGGNHAELGKDRITLNSIELFAVQMIEEYLRRYDNLVMVDLGSMLGFSMNVMNWVFEEEVNDGRLKLLAINFEENITPELLIRESQRRLELLPFYEELETINSKDQDSDRQLVDALMRQIRPMVRTMEELDFIKKYCHGVYYISGIESQFLFSKLKIIGIERVHILHEFFGGIHKVGQPRFVIKNLDKLLKENGIILTPENLLEYEEGQQMYRKKGMLVTKIYVSNVSYYMYAGLTSPAQLI